MGGQPAVGATRRGPGHKAKPVVALVLLVLATGTHLLAQLVAPEGRLADITQILLMPLLAAVLLTRLGSVSSTLARLVLLALFFSWLGDALPRFMSGDAGFLTMVGCFLVAQAFYILAFWPYRAASLLARPVAVLPYLAALTALVLWCAPGAGNLLVPVLLYGIALGLMAVLSTGLGKLAGCGGAVFFISDALIALRSFAGIELPAHGFWIMAGYVLGQGLIVAAVVRRRQVAVRDRQHGAARG